MNKPNKLLDDIAKLSIGAASSALNVGKDIDAKLKEHFERFLMRMNFVKRDEFEAIKKLAQKTAEEQIALKAQIDELTQKLMKGEKGPKGKS